MEYSWYPEFRIKFVFPPEIQKMHSLRDLRAYPFATPELNSSIKAGEGRTLLAYNKGEIKKLWNQCEKNVKSFGLKSLDEYEGMQGQIEDKLMLY